MNNGESDFIALNKKVVPDKGDRAKQNTRPLFSVVITTRNRANLLKRALNSLISQTEEDWEAIIVDDGSTDDTSSMIKPYLLSCPNMKYIRKSHSGAVHARNEGIRASVGKFVTFLDSDDEYHPDHLKSRRKHLSQNPSVMFLYGGAKILGNPYVPDKDNPAATINLKDCVIGGTFIIEREALLSLDGFRDIVLGSDADLFERVKKAGISMAEVKQPTYIYHHENPQSETNKLYLKIKNRTDRFSG
ncbi:MAG: glycosyltransferase family 2 protein [Bacteroidales bacterium]|nr:glycosyltransferase family 2 protein [Bacteroidales bacterium]